MTWVDIVILALPAILGLVGLFHGFVRQASSWAGIILGHFAGIRYYPAIQGALRLRSLRGSEAIAYLLAFVAVYVAARLVGMLVERWARASPLSAVERLAGGVAGLAKGALLSILLVCAMTSVLPREYGPLARSRYAPAALAAGARISGLLPGAVKDAFRAIVSAPVPPAEDQPKNRPRK